MASLNVKREPTSRTFEGAAAVPVSDTVALRRAVLSCLLWEDTFYENGATIADRIAALAKACPTETVIALAVEARTTFKMRHAPLWLAVALAESGRGATLRRLLPQILLRADEPGELLALWWRNGRRAIPAGMKRGLAATMPRFSAYHLAKYDRASRVRLRDVLFLTHPKPKDAAQAETWRALVDGTLPSPDTWEVALSAGNDKREAWSRLLAERKLGALALLRNLRNMVAAGVEHGLMVAALNEMDVSMVFPYRFLSAARHAPTLEPWLEQAMFRALNGGARLRGHTVICVDYSGSMATALSDRSEVTRAEAAAGLAILAREVCERATILRFNTGVTVVPPRRGMALRDALGHPDGGTDIREAVRTANALAPDRIIVLTDEQSSTPVDSPAGRGYMVNVSPYRQSIGYGPWTRIEGWSEGVLRYIQEIEMEEATASV